VGLTSAITRLGVGILHAALVPIEPADEIQGDLCLAGFGLTLRLNPLRLHKFAPGVRQATQLRDAVAARDDGIALEQTQGHLARSAWVIVVQHDFLPRGPPVCTHM